MSFYKKGPKGEPPKVPTKKVGKEILSGLEGRIPERLLERLREMILPVGDLTPKQTAFLAAYAVTGSKASALEASSCSHSSLSKWREKPGFERCLKAAEEFFRETLVAEAVRRGRDGWDEPVYQNGQLVGFKRRYSDRLLVKLLEAKHPEFAPKQEVDVRFRFEDPYGQTIEVGGGMRKALQEPENVNSCDEES